MTTTRLPKTITAGALLATPIPPVKWIIPGLLPAGLAIFAGPSKAGKSWLTLWLCLQISQGKSVWGREIEPRTVLYFSLEDTLGRLQERLYQLVDAEEDPERLILQTESHGIGQGLEEQIVSFIHTYPDISLIVIDTLQKVRKGDQNGSMYANDYRDIGALKELADKYGICILLVHHLRKQSSSDPYDQISGSTGIMGVADTTWLMHRQRMSKTATIRVIGRDMDEKMLAYSAKVRPDQIGESDTTDTLTNGVSSRRNQLLMDISSELGVASVDGAAEATVKALSALVNKVAPNYKAFGPVLSDIVRDRVRGLFGAAGVKLGQITKRVTDTWQLGEGWASHVVAALVLETREGASSRGGDLASLSTEAASNAAAANALIAAAEQKVLHYYGIAYEAPNPVHPAIHTRSSICHYPA